MRIGVWLCCSERELATVKVTCHLLFSRQFYFQFISSTPSSNAQPQTCPDVHKHVTHTCTHTHAQTCTNIHTHTHTHVMVSRGKQRLQWGDSTPTQTATQTPTHTSTGYTPTDRTLRQRDE